MLSSLRLMGSTECVVFDGAVDKSMFTAYMNDMLLPARHPDDTVILDNLSAHRGFDASKFAARGITIKYLPAYSPALNPIEKMWSKVKTKLRERQATDAESLFLAIGEAFSSITASNAEGGVKVVDIFNSKSL